MKSQPAFDDTLVAKAVNFLKSVNWDDEESSDAFLSNFGETRDESLTNFVQSIVVLISSANQIITTATMKMLENAIANSSSQFRLSLVKADLIPQLTVTLNPLSLSFTEAVDIHTSLMTAILNSVWLLTPAGLEELGVEDPDDELAVPEMVFKQVLVPSEKYIWHLCVNRFSIVVGKLSRLFLLLLARLIEISPSYRPTMDFVLHLPHIADCSNHLLSTQHSRLVHPSLIQPLPTLLEVVSPHTRHSLRIPRGCTAWTSKASSSISYGFGVETEGLVTNAFSEIVLLVFGDAGQVGTTDSNEHSLPCNLDLVPNQSIFRNHSASPRITFDLSGIWGDSWCLSEGVTTTALDRRSFLCHDERLLETAHRHCLEEPTASEDKSLRTRWESVRTLSPARNSGTFDDSSVCPPCADIHFRLRVFASTDLAACHTLLVCTWLLLKNPFTSSIDATSFPFYFVGLTTVSSVALTVL
ncbi:hypothetical protein BLNAU_4002 [Blattamonas nauphoetae]|uniref:Uncharacterized protein n=1 Tax=Blattamonas nauphoetae TaxID=2049346 RepID=A0ABQ9YB15_9EUKA|nr:hypothetical protein BLNAU_4002 [Blattamonas nauphoetae]